MQSSGSVTFDMDPDPRIHTNQITYPDPALFFSGFQDAKQNFLLISCCWSFTVLRIRIRDPVPFWPLDPGAGIGFFRIPDPKHIFWKFSDNFLGKKFYNSLKIYPNLFLQHLKHKIINTFVKSVATKKVMTTIFFFKPLFCSCFWIRDPGWVKIRIRDPGWVKIRIRDKHPGSATLGIYIKLQI